MLLYRPLIIDWLPVSLPAHPTKPLPLHPPPSPTLSLSPCLIVSPLIPTVSFSSLSCLLLFLSLPLSLFFFSFSTASLLQLYQCWAQLFTAACYIAHMLFSSVGGVQAEGHRLLLTSPAPLHCPATPALSALLGASFDAAGLSCFVWGHG